MKNIHVIPTDKPSRLHYSKVKNDDGISYKLVLKKELSKCNDGLLSGQRHVYITSDEEIKVGDWFYSVRELIEKAIINYPKGEHFGKIILTTDQSLDGVQAIYDEFLEWFVKNPSCENADVNDWLDTNSNIAFGGDKRYQICNHLHDKKSFQKKNLKKKL